jgi:3',5'-nucleoside bisphosphate phosphatase
MKTFRADLHIHTVLSPCGDLDMSPGKIVSEAADKGLDIIGITDHNSTRHCSLVKKMAAERGIFVMQGAEITTKEEVHCLAFFENTETLKKAQEFLDTYLPEFPNAPEIFGEQVQVDENENIIYEEKKLLLNALTKSISEVEIFVHSLGGLFIPAHIDRKKNSIYSQLGFLPVNLKADALEISSASSPKQYTGIHPEITEFPIIRSSDSHHPATIGRNFTVFYLLEPSFPEIVMAIKGINGRNIISE